MTGTDDDHADDSPRAAAGSDDDAPSSHRHLGDAALRAERLTGRREDTDDAAKRSLILRLARMSVGTLVLLAGIAMLALPGPGWVAIAGGLAILSRDVEWADKLLRIVREKAPGVPADGKIPMSTWISIALVTASFAIIGGLVWNRLAG